MRRSVLGEFFLGAKPLKIEGLTTQDIKVSTATGAHTLTGEARRNFRADERSDLNVQRWASWALATLLTASTVAAGIRSEVNDDRLDTLEERIEGIQVPVEYAPITRTEHASNFEVQEYREKNADQTKWQLVTAGAGILTLLAGANALMAGSRRRQYNSRSFEVYMQKDSPYVNTIASRGDSFYYPEPQVSVSPQVTEPIASAE